MKLTYFIIANLLLSSITYVLALGLRFDFTLEEMLWPTRIIVGLSILLLSRLATYIFFDFNRRSWRFTSSYDLYELIKVHSISSVVFTTLVMFLRVDGFPRSVIFIEYTLSIILSGGLRFLTRATYEKYLLLRSGKSLKPKKVLVIGGGITGQLVVRNFIGFGSGKYKAVGILDDNPQLKNFKIHGVRVLGAIDDLSSVLTGNIDLVIFAIPRLASGKRKELERICHKQGVLYQNMHSFEDIVSGITNPSQTEQVGIEHLLAKEIDVSWSEDISKELAQKTVLITGAGGSIGSELSRQIANSQTTRLILIDQNEYALHNLSRKINTECEKHFILADILNKNRIEQIFSVHRPDIIFHAAAYKHVPFVESSPLEAFTNNILATKNLIEASRFSTVKKFITISSDKAVQPTSLMGASKRITELMMFDANISQEFKNQHFSAVRFGNVINSSGSVIPLFKSQILAGGPITVTDKDMVRFFMSTPEAVRLVLTAGVLGDEGGLFVLDMGNPIKVLDVAKRMRSLYGRDDIEIVFTGIRPGEKLEEFVTSPCEIAERTRFNKIDRLLPPSTPVGVFNWVDSISESLLEMKEEQVKAEILSYVQEVDAQLLNGLHHKTGLTEQQKIFANLG